MIKIKTAFLAMTLSISYISLNAQVTLYRDINYGGDNQGLSAGAQNHCMCTRERGGGIDHLFDCPGEAVRNDEVSSVKVQNGYAITVWWDCEYGGEQRTFTEDCPDVGPHWNDQISSYKVFRLAQPQSPPPHPGYVYLKNSTSSDLLYYYFYTPQQVTGIIDPCVKRSKSPIRFASGQVLRLDVPQGNILYYYICTGTECNLNFERTHGNISYNLANGGTIFVN